MSDYIQALAIDDVEPDQAARLSRTVIQALVAEGIVEPVVAPQCVLSGEGYPPGSRIVDCVSLPESHPKFWELQTCGMQVCAGRWVNEYCAECLETFTCDGCGASFAWGDEVVSPRFIQAMGAFKTGEEDNPKVRCPRCGVASSVHTWQTVPHLGFVNLALVFWNWPSFTSEHWKVDVPAIVQQATGHPVIQTYGKL